MKQRLFAMLLAVLMLCALVGCDKNTDEKSKGNDKTTTTTTAPEPEAAPLTLVEDADPETCYRYVDSTAVETNETVVLSANTDLTNVQFVSLSSSDALVVDEVLYTLPSLGKLEFWCIETYVNDAIPTRGVVCTDESGKTYYYAITCSMKGDDSPSLSLTELNIESLSEKKLVAIEAFLVDEENNGFVSMNEYTCPEEVSLFDALYSGAGIGVGSWEWTDEEVRDYMVTIGLEEMYIPVLRFQRGDVEALLQKRLGISLADLTGDIDIHYIEKYDAYYHAHSDTQYQPIHVLHGWLEGDEGGLYVIDYEIGYMGDTGRVTLKQTKDGYQFVSNQYTEPLTEPTIKQMNAEQQDEMETYFNKIENNGFVSYNIYSCPEEVSLFGALYDGAGIGVGSWEWTDEEVQDYIVAAEWEELYTSVMRFAKADVEALLQEKLGISIADLTEDINMQYIEKYDAYYHAHSDTWYQAVEVENGYISGDRCVVYYRTRQSESFPYEYRTVILWITEDGYWFASNQ